MLSLPTVSDATIKVVVNVVSIEYDSTTLNIQLFVRTQDKASFTISMTALTANVADALAIVPAIKTRIINFVFNQHGVVVVAGEIAVFNAPQ